MGKTTGPVELLEYPNCQRTKNNSDQKKLTVFHICGVTLLKCCKWNIVIIKEQKYQ